VVGRPIDRGKRGIAVSESRGSAQSIRYVPPDLHPMCWLSVLYRMRRSNRVSEADARANEFRRHAELVWGEKAWEGDFLPPPILGWAF
jgi:hypothetical protein